MPPSIIVPWPHTLQYYWSERAIPEISPFAATWMDLEIIILSEVTQRQILYDITYLWNLKNNENEPICKIEIESQM